MKKNNYIRKRELFYKSDRKELVDVPNLIELQLNSFDNFFKEGIREELQNISPILGAGGKYELEFLDGYNFDAPTANYEECLQKEITYSSSLRVPVRLINTETGEVKEQEIFMSDIPRMTDKGTFLINGAERVIVSQFIRSPGIYFRKKLGLNKVTANYICTMIPNRGAWLEIESDANNIIYAHINKLRKLPITTFLGALGYTQDDILKNCRDKSVLMKTFEKAPIESKKECLIEVYRKLRPGDPVSVDGAKTLLNSLFFDNTKYDLSTVGRYKINKKLGLEVDLDVLVLTGEDIIFAINYLIGLINGDGSLDDIDHLGNRRIKSVGEQLQKQFRIGLARLERLIREQMTLKANEKITPQQLINIRPVVAVMRAFFGTSQLSQFMDQTNPVAEIAHKRRLSALGPGGLTKERAGFEVRDIHSSHYGRICPIETPEGPNAGLIGPMATFAKVNRFGFLETPYIKVKNKQLTDEVEYLSADLEDNCKIAPYDISVEKNKIKENVVIVRCNKEFIYVDANEVEYIGVSPHQLLGVGCGLIPFLEHDDANRALMGANMQRQAVPLVHEEVPYVGTGMEKVIARDSCIMTRAKNAGVVSSVSASEVVIKQKNGEEDVYILQKYVRSNQNTCRNQSPYVELGEKVKKGQVIAEGTSVTDGELSLGRNILVAFMPWEGYNFEDALVVSERLVKDDIFSSIHIHRYEIDVRSTKLGPEEITREIPNVSEEAVKYLDENGIIKVGAVVRSGAILVGKVTPKGETEPPAEEKLLRAIFGDKARDMKDTSLKVSSGEYGKVIGVRVFSRENNDDLPPGINNIVRIYIAQYRKISIGDKMAGRHGNKGVISTILPEEDMPFLPNGQPIDIILNPLGVPSRMNVGQLFEMLLGMASHVLKENYRAQLFDEAFDDQATVKGVEGKLKEASKVLGYEWIKPSGKTPLRDGRTGDFFEREVTIGYMYILKLIHLVDDKIHARSTGPYSLVTQQPLGGKAQYGGQRFGEMEVWALEAYGAAHTLQEMLTIKSDDLVGRTKAYEAIIKGKPLAKPGTPESFRVLLRELRSIALDVRVVSSDGNEIETR